MADDLKAWIWDRVSPEPNTGCWLWEGHIKTNGYGQACPPGGVSPRTQQAHRLSWKAYRGPIPEGICVCHHCDTRACCNPDHLFLGTKRDNTLDMVKKGRKFGMRLTPELVREIRTSTESSRVIARRLGILDTNVRHIRRGTQWSHV